MRHKDVWIEHLVRNKLIHEVLQASYYITWGYMKLLKNRLLMESWLA